MLPSTSNGIMLHNMNLFYHNVCCGNGTGSFELQIVLWNQPPSSSCRSKLRRCAASRHMLHLPHNAPHALELPACGWFTWRKMRGWTKRGEMGRSKKVGTKFGHFRLQPLSFLCLYHYLKDSHHVYHLYRSAQLRALSVGTKAESPTIPAYVSTKSKPAVTALIIVISSS